MFRLSHSTRCGIALFVIVLLPSPVVLGAQLSAASQSQPPKSSFKIAGTLISSLSGTPLAQARVTVSDVRNPEEVLRVITTENGHFEFTGLKTGKFSLVGAKRGFVTAAYDQHEQFSTAIVTGPELETENLILRLTPLAFLSGKLIDESGDPVREARVSLYLKSTRAGLTRVVPVNNYLTDDEGYYEFPALPPGEYFLSASGAPWYAVHPILSTGAGSGAANPATNVARSLDVAYRITYYNGATDSDAATPIPVKAGDHLQLDIHFNPVPALHLLVRIPETQQGFNMPQFQKRVFDSTESLASGGSQMISNGVFEITGVPADRYIVSVQKQGSQQSAEIVLGEDSQELDLSHGELSGKVKLKVIMPQDDTPPRQIVVALRNSRQQFVATGAVDANGEVTLEHIPPGKYGIVAGAATKPYSVVRMSSPGAEKTEIPGHDIDLAPDASLDLTIYLATAAVTLEGFVKRGEKPASGIMVALVPKDPESNLEMFRRDQSDLDGSFMLRDVFPGTYSLIAFEDAWGFAWLQPGILSRYLRNGQNINIGAQMKGSVHLPEPVQVQPH